MVGTLCPFFSPSLKTKMVRCTQLCWVHAAVRSILPRETRERPALKMDEKGGRERKEQQYRYIQYLQTIHAAS